MNHCITKATMAAIAVMACVGTLSLGAPGYASASESAATTTMTPLFVQADTVSALKSDDCWLANTFHAGDIVVFRVQVFNGATGDKMPPSEMKSVIIGGLPVIGALPATYSTRDGWWTAPWRIPKTVKPGVINYTVTAQADNGSSGKYVPFNAVTSELTVVAAGKPAVG